MNNSIKFICTLENTSYLLGGNILEEIVAVYADKGYDAVYITDYLKSCGIKCRIPYKKSFKLKSSKNLQKGYNKTRLLYRDYLDSSNAGIEEL